MAHSLSTSSFSRHVLRAFPAPRFLCTPAVGMEISTQAVRFLELIGTEKKQIGRFGVFPVPPGILSQEREILDASALRKLLTSIREQTGISFVNVSLPEAKSYFFRMTVPVSVTPDQIRGVVEFSLEEHVPISPAEVVFDFEIIPHAMSAQGQEVAVSVYPRQMIEQYLAVLQDAGLTPRAFEVEMLSLARAVVPQGDIRPHLVVRFGTYRTSLAIIDGGIPAFTATFEIGGNTLTKALTKGLSITEEEAEHLKKTEGFMHQKKNRELYESLMITMSAVKEEIERHLRYWATRPENESDAGRSIKKILLCGGEAGLGGFPEYLEAALRMPVERANVWTNVFSFDETIPPISRDESLTYTTVIGLALRTTVF